jgi:hypothetical protein
MAMGTKEDVDALVGGDALTTLTEYISRPDATVEVLPMQLSCLISWVLSSPIPISGHSNLPADNHITSPGN